MFFDRSLGCSQREILNFNICLNFRKVNFRQKSLALICTFSQVKKLILVFNNFRPVKNGYLSWDWTQVTNLLLVLNFPKVGKIRPLVLNISQIKN